MSVDPERSAPLSDSTAAELAAAAASSPAAGSNRHASDDSGPNDVGPLSADSSVSAKGDDQAVAAPQFVAAAPAAIDPPWSTLYSDALHSIFGFASLQDLARLMSVSRRWGEAVMVMPPVPVPARIVSSMHLLGILHSRVRRHVSALCGRFGSAYWISNRFHLQWVSAQAPWLAELCVTLPMSIPHGEAVAWCVLLSRFNKLRILCVGLSDQSVEYLGPHHDRIPGYNLILHTIGGLSPTTMHTLVLQLPSSHDKLSFAPLAGLTHLRRFSVHMCTGPDDEPAPLWLTDAQIDELRALTSVQQISTPYRGQEETEFLVRMLQPGHALQWNVLGVSAFIEVTAPLAAVLGSLPTLTSLSAELHCPDVQFLSHLRALTDVELRVGNQEDPALDLTELVTSLRRCSQITRLDLSGFALTGRHLEELLPALPRLAGLTLWSLRQLNSLRCLHTAALAVSLTELALRDLSLCPTTEITHLFGLRLLQRLAIAGLADSLTDEQKAELSPHSQRFPQLDHSKCQ